jgi:predicted phosphodiesterase
MSALRIIGDVHAQIHPDDVLSNRPLSYLQLIAEAEYSIQVGDMGDAETYEQLRLHVDPERHRFFPGNHEDYRQLPPHCLGDFGALTWGGVNVFLIRGAASSDRAELVSMGKELGKTFWFEQEELTEEQMHLAEAEYLSARPEIVLSHDAPTHIARFAREFARRFRAPNPKATFRPSRTNAFLSRLLDAHAPRLWLFGHHHHDWQYREAETLFVCVGELSFVDIDAAGAVIGK